METASPPQPGAPTNRDGMDTTSQDPNTGVEDIFWSSSTDETDNDRTRRSSHTVIDSRFSCNICFDAVTEPVVTQCGHLYCWPCLYRWLEPGIFPNEREGLLSGTMVMQPPRAPVDESRRCCPVCKAECSIPTIVPIYIRNEPPTPQQKSRKRAQRRNTQPESEPVNTTRATSSETPEEPDESESRSQQESPNEQNTGLRRRLRFRSHDSEIPDVPSRPAPSSPQRRSPNSTPTPYMQQATTTHYRQPLSHGLAHSLWQSLSSGEAAQPIPSLHQNRRGGAGQHSVNYEYAVAQDDDATEFLWRLLLMLGSFVVLCLLIF